MSESVKEEYKKLLSKAKFTQEDLQLIKSTGCDTEFLTDNNGQRQKPEKNRAETGNDSDDKKERVIELEEKLEGIKNLSEQIIEIAVIDSKISVESILDILIKIINDKKYDGLNSKNVKAITEILVRAKGEGRELNDEEIKLVKGNLISLARIILSNY